MAVISTGKNKNGKDMKKKVIKKKMSSLQRWANDPRWKDVNKLREKWNNTQDFEKRKLIDLEMLTLQKAIDKSYPI